MSKKEKKAGKRMNKKQLTELLMALFQQHPTDELPQKYIFIKIKIIFSTFNLRGLYEFKII